MAERTTSQLMGATLLGGLMGAGLAVLFAPRSGKETRQQIHNQLDELKDEAQDKMHKAKDKIRGGMDEARDLRDRLAEAARKTNDIDESELEAINKSSRKGRTSVLSAWEEEV